MPAGKDIVRDIWKSYPDYLGKDSVSLSRLEFTEFLASMFCPGPSFHYVLDSPSLTFDLVSPGVASVLGIPQDALSVETFVATLHPDDLDFFLRCEDVIAHFLKNLVSPEKIVKYKITSCLRHRVATGDYRLLLKQTLTLQTMENGALLKVFGSHTDISHITTEHTQRLSFIGLDGETSFTGIDVFSVDVLDGFKPYVYELDKPAFTRRELEVIRRLGQGQTTAQIARALRISAQTVITHRRNILRKSGAENTTRVVADCIRNGLI